MNGDDEPRNLAEVACLEVGHHGALAWCANGPRMDDKPSQPTIPMVPMNAATLAANLVYVGYAPGNGSFVLQVGDQREAPIERIGDAPKQAAFEIGRFVLTPRAVRLILETTQAAIKAYENAVGKPLPTNTQFDASAAIQGLFPPALSPKDKPPEGT